jgi:hypothetical protein
MFWVLNNPEPEATDRVYGVIGGDDEPLWETTPCSECERITIVRQIQDISLELYGTTLFDFVWMDSPGVLVSWSMMNLLKQSGLNGFTFRNVNIIAWWRDDPVTGEIVDWLEREEAPPLYQLVILGKGGSILPKNQVKVQSACSECGAAEYEFLKEGVLVDQSQWDGSDIFTLNELGWTFITEKFLKFLVENHIHNYTAIPSDKFSMMR